MKKFKDFLKEDWSDVNRKDNTDGMSQKAVNAYRRENPGSKLQTAVTEKDPSGKRASRRKSFCARMSGMKRAHASAETKRDPDSPINKHQNTSLNLKSFFLLKNRFHKVPEKFWRHYV